MAKDDDAQRRWGSTGLQPPATPQPTSNESQNATMSICVTAPTARSTNFVPQSGHVHATCPRASCPGPAWGCRGTRQSPRRQNDIRHLPKTCERHKKSNLLQTGSLARLSQGNRSHFIGYGFGRADKRHRKRRFNHLLRPRLQRAIPTFRCTCRRSFVFSGSGSPPPGRSTSRNASPCRPPPG